MSVPIIGVGTAVLTNLLEQTTTCGILLFGKEKVIYQMKSLCFSL